MDEQYQIYINRRHGTYTITLAENKEKIPRAIYVDKERKKHAENIEFHEVIRTLLNLDSDFYTKRPKLHQLWSDGVSRTQEEIDENTTIKTLVNKLIELQS